MTGLWPFDPISLYSHDITWPLNPLCRLVLKLRSDSWKCSSFSASIVCLSPHRISRVSIILTLLHCRKGSQVYFSINLLSTAEYSYFSFYSTTVILSLVGNSFTTFITVPELPTRHIHWAAPLHDCLQITTSHQCAAYRLTTTYPQ